MKKSLHSAEKPSRLSRRSGLLAGILAAVCALNLAGCSENGAASSGSASSTSSDSSSSSSAEQSSSADQADSDADGAAASAEKDIQNEDGTYTQALGSALTVSVPEFVTNVSGSWSVDEAATRSGYSNPSVIPYSEITLENAAEAFPYLGFIGYTPDYIEILPTDDSDAVAAKVWNNIIGTTAASFYLEDSKEPENTAVPGHFFASEEEYNEYLANKDAE